ncbi:GNAT family N-acetyltransferase [Candidatus Xianfuyuplasma coldseepsis]|uniref:GNAT family N-acetyltransferase n=1 Tax=Candidatus Xianfuyuplasma coldseepsis TaxID=2782163 RepID=A0A7L7KQF4_9MOLU|nr:GNAT family N-acetyltransferase [Xianfuyuplasma coldseepsis]QMS84815.1 GNAT family N-acetyltransferase [Xianfuyuplasma coldseepsis]
MKKFKRLYYILSYVFFILPPFIWGLVELYLERDWKVHVVSLVVNLIVLFIITLVLWILTIKNVLHVPNKEEQRQLLFGLIGNTVVYFYTFQNPMNLQNVVTIYLILLIILVVRYYLLKRKISNYELWILLPIFLLIDTLHILLTGCGFSNLGGYCVPNEVPHVVLYLLYSTIVVITIGYYAYKVYLYRRWNFWGITNITLVVLTSIFIQEIVDADEKIIGTLTIALAFFVILDFIVSIVNKVYTHRTLIFYVRTTTLLILISLLSEEDFFIGQADEDMLVLMVIVTYVSFGITILKSLLHITEEADTTKANFTIEILTEDLRNQIKENYGDVAYDYMEIGDNIYSLIAIEDNTIIGFISTYTQPLKEPLEDTMEAYINIIEVHKDYRRQGIASTLINETEHYFKRQGIPQIRAWSSMDKVEAIQLWQALNYNLSPTTIHIDSKNVNVEGYYVVKSL